MAPTKLISFAFLFVALMFFCHEIDSAVGRPLKTTTETDPHLSLHLNREKQLLERPAKEGLFHGESVDEEGSNGNVSPPKPPSTAAVYAPGRKVDDFRPTTPGHSPGVGHSVQN